VENSRAGSKMSKEFKHVKASLKVVGPPIEVVSQEKSRNGSFTSINSDGGDVILDISFENNV